MLYSTRKSWLLASLLVLLLAVGCGEDAEDTEGGGGEEIDYTHFDAFDEANMTNQLLRLDAHADIVTLRGEATLDNNDTTFAEIETAYQANSLQDKVAGRTDDHVTVKGWGFDGVGGFLDAQITHAIELGKTTEDADELAWAGQVVDKSLLVFFYYSVYHELYERQRKNFDEAFGYWGLDFEGTPRENGGLSNKASGRESEFGVALNGPIFKAFIDGRHALADATADGGEVGDDNAAYNTAWETIDAHMLQTLAYYAMHELDGYDDTNAAVKLVEARIIWEGVAPYAEQVDSTTAQAIYDGLYPGGRPAMSEDGYFLSGLAEVAADPTLVDPEAVYANMETIVETLQ